MKKWIPDNYVKLLVFKGAPIKGFTTEELWNKSTFYNGGKNYKMSGVTYKYNRICFSDDLINSKNLKRQASVIYHELVHVAQQLEMGWFRFMCKYLDQWRRSGFKYSKMKKHSIEGEAYFLQGLYDQEVLM